MQPTLYTHRTCGTCRKALAFLANHEVTCREIPIREQPPTLRELRRMLAVYDGNLRRLFNTSGLDYRKLKMGERLAGMSGEEALGLLAGNGNLVKRPFMLTDRGGAVGFKEAEWCELLGLE